MIRAFTICFVLITFAIPALTQDAGSNSASSSTIRLVSSNNPSSYGDPVELTAIFPEGTSGTITFMEGSVKLATRTINSGQAMFRTAKLRLGEHRITATYTDGNGTFSAGLIQTVHQADPNVVLYCSPNFSIYGEALGCEAVLPPDATGTVTFMLEGHRVADVTPVEGSATYSMKSPGAGSHLLSASYSGDKNYTPSNGHQTQTIMQAHSRVRVWCAPNPAYYDETITCAAQTPEDATGAVAFMDAGLTVAKVTLENGVAVLHIPGAAVGTHEIRVSYQGDTNYLESKSGYLLSVTDPYAGVE